MMRTIWAMQLCLCAWVCARRTHTTLATVLSVSVLVGWRTHWHTSEARKIIIFAEAKFWGIWTNICLVLVWWTKTCFWCSANDRTNTDDEDALVCVTDKDLYLRCSSKQMEEERLWSDFVESLCCALAKAGFDVIMWDGAAYAVKWNAFSGICIGLPIISNHCFVVVVVRKNIIDQN